MPWLAVEKRKLATQTLNRFPDADAAASPSLWRLSLMVIAFSGINYWSNGVLGKSAGGPTIAALILVAFIVKKDGKLSSAASRPVCHCASA